MGKISYVCVNPRINYLRKWSAFCSLLAFAPLRFCIRNLFFWDLLSIIFSHFSCSSIQWTTDCNTYLKNIIFKVFPSSFCFILPHFAYTKFQITGCSFMFLSNNSSAQSDINLPWDILLWWATVAWKFKTINFANCCVTPSHNTIMKYKFPVCFKGFFMYHISSNKHWASNKRRTFGYPHLNKCLPLTSAAPLNPALIRIVTMFYLWLNQNAYETSVQTIKQWKYCWYLELFIFSFF